MVPPPLALYVHLPWCVRKCPYCDFNSHAVPAAGLPEAAYLAALLADLEDVAPDCAGRPLVCVFFGGGTPSLFSAESIDRLLARMRQLFVVDAALEVTLEANPGTLERGRFAAYRDAGITRVSLGAQSFDDRCLAALGRIHSREDTFAAVDELRSAGLHDFNLDLMFALPGQDPDGALADVEQALRLGPTHLSHYQLTLEPGTAFERRPPVLPDEESIDAMQRACEAALAAAGFAQYEVAAYARDGRECRHNLNYWTFGDYLGIGAGAHGKLTDAAGGRVVRTARVRQPGRYVAARTRDERNEERRVPSPEELVFEFCLNALRLVRGFEPALFEARTGLPWSTLEARVAQARGRGLLVPADAGPVRPTPLGRRFLNDLQAVFLPDRAPLAPTDGRRGLAMRGGIG
jgi:putative oxygen-independent coproporphyrinogen III oxidase